MNLGGRISWRARIGGATAALCLLAASSGRAETPWSDKDTRLAGEYLNMLVDKPEYGRVLDLIWDLYDKHNATPLLLESINAQVKKQPHPSVLLVHAHLLRKAGKFREAVGRYTEVLKQDAKNAAAMRALADISEEQGQRDAAIGYLQKLLETLPEGDAGRAPLLVEMGRVQLESGKRDEAAALWERAVKLPPEDLARTREVAQLMLGAGLLDKALVFYRQLAKTGEPAARLDALFDLARMEEQADHFPQAVAALREGLAILHFKDWRYQQFFQRLVKAHERFGQLDALKRELQQAAKVQPPTERALVDIARFSELTVDGDERIRWLRELVRLFPDSVDYRWQLVGMLIDHDGHAEAAKLLDERLKNDGADMPAMVLLRCLAHLRAGELAEASSRLRKLYEAQGGNSDVEKQILAFAREKSLDDVIELILKARIARDPEKSEPVFELASFYKGRNDLKSMTATLDAFSAGLSGRGQQERLNQIATFLAGTNDTEAAEAAARKAAAIPGAGSDETLQLADVLVQNGKPEDAATLLEQAWTLSDTPDKRVDVDERIFSLLAGDEAPRPAPPIESSTEFKMPAMFTGQGFGSDAPVDDKKTAVPLSVANYAFSQALEVLLGSPTDGADLAALSTLVPIWIGSSVDPSLWRLVHLAQPATPERTQRAAWWAFRTSQLDLAYVLVRRLIFDASGRRIQVPLDVEKLLLDIAMADRNRLLTLRQLELITALDPVNKAAYSRRLCEQYLEMAADPAPRDEHERSVSTRLRFQATKILEELVREDPQNEAVISALAQCYAVEGRRDKGLALWQKAAQSAKGNAAPLLERYGDALIAQRKFKEYLETQGRVLESETDVKRRREIFQRTLERLLFVDSFNGDLPDDEKKKRLDLISTVLGERARRHPFDGFWHETLAGVFEKAGDPAKAFAEMKQAYYTSPDTPFTLDQLRAAAMKVGDLKSAIYFQKQVAAAATGKDEASEWRQLVQLLEEDFRMNEADQARRRLEARISQDPAALEELAKYYNETGQDDAARRVQEQITRVKGWDGRALLRLALTQKQAGNPSGAVLTLRGLLTSVKAPAQPENAALERWPWPLLDERKPTPATSPLLLNSLDNTAGLEPKDRERLRVFLSLPRQEFAELPDEPAQVRLRAVEELAKLDPAAVSALKGTFSEMEKLWADYYAGHGEDFRHAVSARLGKADTLEAQFLQTWLGLRSHGVADVLVWGRRDGLDDSHRKLRRTLLGAVLTVLADDATFSFTAEDARVLGDRAALSLSEIRELHRRMVSRRQFDPAIALLEAARAHLPSLRTAMALMLADTAGMAGRTELEHRYLREIWSQPLSSTRDISLEDISSIEADRYLALALNQLLRAPIPSVSDPFSQSFIRLWRQAGSSAERERLLRESWARVHRLPPSAQNTLRSARILSVTGATGAGGEKLAQYFSRSFLATRPFAEPVYKNVPKGAQLGPRIDELNHLRDYWRDGIEWGLALQEEGLGEAAVAVDEAVDERNGGVPIGAKSNYEFGTWKNQALARRLRGLGYSARVRLIREQLQEDESVETMRDLGGFLEGQGFARESIEVYRRLPGRAPSNSEYCESFVRACEVSWDFRPALPYLERLFDPDTDPVFKPLTLNFEVLRERHARFLAQMQDEAKLRSLAFRMAMPKLVPGRIPEAVPYLKELALLLERRGDKAGALAAWEQLHTLWQTDHDATYHRATILVEQGNKARALEALRAIPLNTGWSEATQRALPLRAELVAAAGLWEEMRELMNAATGSATAGGSPSPLQIRGAIAIKEVLLKYGRKTEASSLLVRAERAAKDDVDRNRLRLEQLKLAALDPAWTPAQAVGRIGSLMRSPAFDSEIMDAMVAWMKTESGGPRAAAWIAVLGSHAATEPLAALGLSPFAAALDAQGAALLTRPWGKGRDSSRAAQLLTMQTLLELGRPALAFDVAQATAQPQVTESPMMVKVLAALKDRHRLDELFARKIRQNFPGGGDVVALAEAFAAAGRTELADELYSRRLDHLRATNASFPQLVESYAKHLIRLHRFEQAETLLMKENTGITAGLPALLVDLYRGWGKLDRLPQELTKFELPIGVEAEAKFLASRRPSA